MAKRSRSTSRSRSRSQSRSKSRSQSLTRSLNLARSLSRSRSQMGGSDYTSGSSYGDHVNGSGPAQFARTFDQTGPYGSRVGSEYVGAQGQWSTQPGTPSAQNLSLIQSAGKRRSRSRSRKGGLWGQVINQAIVPFSILGMQQSFRRKKHGGKTHKRRRH